MKRIIFSLCLFLWAGTSVWAQRTITGRVFDHHGEPLNEVTIYAMGSQSGTVTDLDGKYTLEAPDDATVIKFAYDSGWSSPEVPVDASNVLNVVMAPYLPYLIEETSVGQVRLDKTVVVHGKIYDENKAPLPGARVEVLGLDNAPVATADAEGAYRLEIPPGPAVLQFSHGESWSAASITIAESCYMDVFLPSKQMIRKWKKRLEKKQKGNR